MTMAAMNEVVIICGIQASGKSSLAEKYLEKGYVQLNRDKIGGKMDDLLPMLDTALQRGKCVVMDNTFPTVMVRKPFIGVAMKNSTPIRCEVMDTSIEDAQFNAVERIINLRGKLLTPEEIKNDSSPNIFPPTVLFSFRKRWEPPTTLEGFSSVETFSFVRRPKPEYTGKAILLDYDGTLRKTKSGRDYPIEPDDVEILPGRKEKLQACVDDNYRLLGISNQSGVQKGLLSNGAAKACFDRTNKLLGHNIDYVYCPHASFPIACYCRKPMPGWGVHFIHKYKLKAADCIMVGDFKTDRTFAERSGFQYLDQSEFFT